MMRRCLILLMLLSGAAQAQTPEALPGNLPPGFYPQPPCPKPVPEKENGEAGALGMVNPQLAVDSYSRNIEKFNKAVVAYNSCAKTYIQNSRYDIARIVSTVNTVVAEVQGTAPPLPPTGTGNLPVDFYPRSACVKPDQASIGVQPGVKDIKAMTAYNLRVAAFNQDVVTFNACLKTYQEKARHDIEEIRAAVQPPAAPAQPSPAPVAQSPAPAVKAPAPVVKAAPPSRSSAPPVESVTVTGASSKAVNNFVQAAATPTHVIGKVARWEVPICPYALGLPDDVIALVVKRVKDVAVQAGARVSSDPACKPNIVIAFTSTPQDLLDSIRKDHRQWLGYQSSSEELDRLGTVTRPIQAWYSTATVDLKGQIQTDSPRTDSNGRGLQITAPCILVGGGGKQAGSGGTGNGYRDPTALCTTWFPNAIKAEVEASRLADGLRATFDHVTIIANPLSLHADRQAMNDYIAMLALAQIGSLDPCQALPSITSLLASGCAQETTAITANDLGYLKAVYAANPEKLRSVQKNEIAHRMEQAGQ